MLGTINGCGENQTSDTFFFKQLLPSHFHVNELVLKGPLLLFFIIFKDHVCYIVRTVLRCSTAGEKKKQSAWPAAPLWEPQQSILSWRPPLLHCEGGIRRVFHCRRKTNSQPDLQHFPGCPSKVFRQLCLTPPEDLQVLPQHNIALSNMASGFRDDVQG